MFDKHLDPKILPTIFCLPEISWTLWSTDGTPPVLLKIVVYNSLTICLIQISRQRRCVVFLPFWVKIASSYSSSLFITISFLEQLYFPWTSCLPFHQAPLSSSFSILAAYLSCSKRSRIVSSLLYLLLLHSFQILIDCFLLAVPLGFCHSPGWSYIYLSFS